VVNTIKIYVVFLGRASELVKERKSIFQLEVDDNTTLDELMKIIGERIDEKIYRRYIEGHYVFIPFVNNKPVSNPREYVLRDGDRVVFITPEMGG